MMTPLKWRILCRANILHEAVELGAQARAFARQRPCRAQHLFRGRAGFGGAAIDLHDVDGGILGPLRDVLDVARDFLRRRALLLHGGRNRGGDIGDLADGRADLLDGRDRFLRRLLHAGNMVDISSVAFAVWLASDLTSGATTAKLRPASPARAASMVA